MSCQMLSDDGGETFPLINSQYKFRLWIMNKGLILLWSFFKFALFLYIFRFYGS